VAVLMVPFPAQSHLNQLLQFSCIVSSYGLPVHYLSSAIHIHQVKSRVNGIDPRRIGAVRFKDLPHPPFDSPQPDPNSENNFPSQFFPAWYAAMAFREPFADYLRETCREYRRVVVVYDAGMAHVVRDAVSVENAESYAFRCLPAIFQAALSIGKELPPWFPELPSLQECVPEEMLRFVAQRGEALLLRDGDIHNTCRPIEAPYLEVVEREEILGRRKSWAIGPTFPSTLKNTRHDHECFRWLDGQEPNSVVYVSFGTTTSLTDEQIGEIAFGLRRSGAKFLWVLRDADKADIFDRETRRAELPREFEEEEEAEGVGVVVRDWVPQIDVLRHPSTGGFLSHCGWNSCMESMFAGVPMGAWPMHSDQPTNAVFICGVLGMGLMVRDWSRRTETVKASVVESCVRRLMTTSEGAELRRKAEELGGIVAQATRPGGASSLEMDSFIAHITR
ncbi:hypothetical protein M569_08324, partial [Genlisea aurea]